MKRDHTDPQDPSMPVDDDFDIIDPDATWDLVEDPGAIKPPINMSLSVEGLRPGDIIFIEEKHKPLSTRMVQAGNLAAGAGQEEAAYTHVEICLNKDSVTNHAIICGASRVPGVRTISLDNILPQIERIAVFRPKNVEYACAIATSTTEHLEGGKIVYSRVSCAQTLLPSALLSPLTLNARSMMCSEFCANMIGRAHGQAHTPEQARDFFRCERTGPSIITPAALFKDLSRKPEEYAFFEMQNTHGQLSLASGGGDEQEMEDFSGRRGNNI